MLSHLFIKNFTIVDQLELELDEGLTALTGETGAGKSILLDALGLTLGDRATGDVVRNGADKAEIAVSFNIDGMATVHAWLDEHELDEDGDCLLRRVVQNNGRSKAYINGRPVPLQLLRELGEQLVDIHGQHEHQSMMRRDIQRTILDAFAESADELKQLAELHTRHRGIETELQNLAGGHDDAAARAELLRYQLAELEALTLEPEAIAELDEEHRRLSNAGELLQSAHSLLEMLYDNEASAQSTLGQARRELEAQAPNDPVFAEVHGMVEQALVQLEEGVDSLRRHVDRLDLDPARLQTLDDQIATLNDLARKHRVRTDELIDVREQIRKELHALENAEETVASLKKEQDQILSSYTTTAAHLTKLRETAAENLSMQVTAGLQELGMQGAAFRIALMPMDDDSITPHGRDRISFEVRTNAGQDFGPMSRIASGGELSRISLAIQVVAADGTTIPTLIFDEADVGIGGGVAEVVGRQLRRLGRSHQVLCVTHLPQVASQAHQHLQVRKTSDADSTVSTVAPLNDQARVQEIARMLGGMEITRATLEHAQEMVSRAAAG